MAKKKAPADRGLIARAAVQQTGAGFHEGVDDKDRKKRAKKARRADEKKIRREDW